MSNQAPQLASFWERPPPAFLAFGGSGFLVGLHLYALTFMAMTSSVVRTQEGARSVVDIPWAIYSLLPVLIVTVLTAGIGIRIKRLRQLSFFVGAGISIAFCYCITLSILWRDFIGKF